jgi:esterase/lipase superfamily enzyme
MLRAFIYLIGLLFALHVPAVAQSDPAKTEILNILNAARIDTERAVQQVGEAEQIAENVRQFSVFIIKSDKKAPEEFRAALKESESLVTLARGQAQIATALAEEIEVAEERVIVAEEGTSVTELRSKAVDLAARAKTLAISAAGISASAASLNNRLSREPGSDGYLASTNPQSLEQASGGLDCIKAATCTPVPVFFGTDRTSEQRADRVHFSAQGSGSLSLGRAVVTVPRANREKGDINLRSWWDLLRFKNPWRIDPSSHFTIPDGGVTVMTSDQFIAAVKEHLADSGTHSDHAFIFVHGYNNSFEDGLYRAAQISYDLGEGDKPFGTAFVFSWPSAGAFQDYNYDFTNARLSAKRLTDFINLVIDKTQAAHVHLIAHSMGNWPLVTAFNEVVAKQSGKVKIGQIILAAPDIDAREFAEIAEAMVPGAQTITLYASSADRALIASRRANGALRAGDVTGSETGPAAIVAGIDSIDVSALSTDLLGFNHNTYVESKELLKDMEDLMLSGTRPPDVRNSSFLPGGTSRPFWRYQKR